ncbi:General transcription factor II-I repeat domain-containing protein 2 [Fasciola hepatica]|uniref:General transcription factor II-I repeat domain-containing protein 2 n=1 Tax=Fasciola hepatica TaxID=6192 RepID=A0A4E0RIJ7_FASHE|nr:General transcription factor II-I repeat domain-containing protein 2 [Fasciola hepatica]
MAIVAYDSSSDDELDDDELAAEDSVDFTQRHGLCDRSTGDVSDMVEPEYKMRVPKSAKTVGANDLKASKTNSGRILLSIPSLDELDSSDESADESHKPMKKQHLKNFGPRSAPQSASLLSLLPPTRALIVREGAKPMIPHQLTVKRHSSSKVVLPQAAMASKATLDVDTWDDGINTSKQEDDEDRDEGATSSFFSFYHPTSEDAQAVAGARQAAASSVIQSVLSSDSPGSSEQQIKAVNDTVQSAFFTATTVKTGVAKPTIRTPSLCPIERSVLENLDVPKPPQGEQDASEDDHCYWSDQTFVPGPERKRARINLPDVRGTIPIDELLNTSNQPIREVSQDDLTAGASLELMKSVTSDESQYVSKRASADDDPGKLAHRKHQITWLAFQAQESEMELEKRWAEARRNKASNRAKYGF